VDESIAAFGDDEWVGMSTGRWFLADAYLRFIFFFLKKKTGGSRKRKAIASRYYQLLTGHAPFLKEKSKNTDSDHGGARLSSPLICATERFVERFGLCTVHERNEGSM